MIARTKAVASAALVALSFGAVACGNQTLGTGFSGAEEEIPRASESGAVPVPLQTVEKAFSFFEFDYEEVASPTDLEASSDLIVAGLVQSVVPGRLESYPNDNLSPTRNAAVSVEVETVLKGSAEPGDVIWFELPTDPDVVRPGLPSGAKIALYLNPALPGNEDVELTAEGSQVPDDSPLWVPTHPQGLILQYGRQAGTVEPMGESVKPKASLDKALPED